MELIDKNIGDMVYLDGYTSMAQQNSREVVITGVDYRFDTITGENFKIVQVNDGWYDTRDGSNYSNLNSMYYIE